MEICEKCGCRAGYNHECDCIAPPIASNPERLRQLQSLDNETLAKRVLTLEQELIKVVGADPDRQELKLAPQPPEELVGALQDRIHVDVGRARPGRAMK